MRNPRVRSLSTAIAAEQARARLGMIRSTYGGGLSYRVLVAMVERATGFRYAAKSAERAEKGEARLDAEWLLALCQTTGVEVGWLLQGKGAEPHWLATRREGVDLRVAPGDTVDLIGWLEQEYGPAREPVAA